MAKERPVPSGRKPSNARAQQTGAGYPARPRPTPSTPAPRRPAPASTADPRRPATAGPADPRQPATPSPADPRPIAAPFIQRLPEPPESQVSAEAWLPTPSLASSAALRSGHLDNQRNSGSPPTAPPAERHDSHRNLGNPPANSRPGHPDSQRNSGSPSTAPPAGRHDSGRNSGSPPAGSRPERPGGQRNSGPDDARRGDATAAPRPPFPGLHLQPLVHVGAMPAAVDFYERLGGTLVHGDRDDVWVLMQVGTAQIGLVTRPPDASRGESTVELNFAATMPLDLLEQLLREHGVTIVDVATDADLGTQLHVEAPDGMPIKIHQVEPDLLV